MAKRMMIGPEGREHDPKYMQPEIVRRDRIVRKLFKRAKRLHEQVVKDKSTIHQDLRDYLAKVADDYDETWKGNATLQSFDENLKVEFRRRDRITFGPELQLAKQKIDAFLERRASGADEAIKAIVRDVFSTDRDNSLPVRRILRLRNYRFKDPDWEKAMDLINQSIDVTSTKDYISFYEKDEAGNWVQIVLNFSSV